MEECFSTYDLPFHVLKKLKPLLQNNFVMSTKKPQHLVTTVNHVKMMKKTSISCFVCKGYHSKMKIKTQFYLICFRLCFFLYLKLNFTLFVLDYVFLYFRLS